MLREVVAAPHVENDVDTTLFRPLQRAGKPVFVAIVEGTLRSQREAEAAFLRRPRSRHDTCAKCFRHQNGGGSNATRAAVYQESITLAQIRLREEICPDCEYCL